MGMCNREMDDTWCKAKYGNTMITSEHMTELIKEMCSPSPDESDSTSNKLLSFGQPVWVSHNQKKWKKEFYIGKLEDRSKPYITVETKEQLNQYRIKEGTAPIHFSKHISSKPMEIEYRPFSSPAEALMALGHKVQRKNETGYPRYIALYKTGILVDFPEGYEFFTFSQAFKDLEFAEDNGPFGTKKEQSDDK